MNNLPQTVSATLHGIGRFGQHLLYAWLTQPETVDICSISDPFYTLKDFINLLEQHDKLDFSFATPKQINNQLVLTDKQGRRHYVDFFFGDVNESDLPGKHTLWLECSGQYTDTEQARRFYCGKTQKVLISATSYNADQTLVFGFNQQELCSDSQIISYGSCTVNAFVPLAHKLHTRFPFSDAFVEVVHNSPDYLCQRFPHPYRKHCTLSDMAPKLLTWLEPESVHVSYNMIPYQGASLIQFIFFLKQATSKQQILEYLLQSMMEKGSDLYHFPEGDKGIQSVELSPYNAVFPQSQIQVKGNKLILQGYFDNENSAIRYYQLANFIANQQYL